MTDRLTPKQKAIRDAAVSDRDERPWRYYNLSGADYWPDVQKRLDALLDRAKAAEAKLAALVAINSALIDQTSADRARLQQVETAGKALANEVSGVLGAWWNATSAVIGVTNVRCLERRVAEFRAALLHAPAEAATPKNPTPEVCICAAVRLPDGRVIRGQRHHDCLRAIAALPDESVADRWPLLGGEAQGFITSMGRYVDRREGRRLQEAAGIGSVAPGGYRGDLLFSEDLY